MKLKQGALIKEWYKRYGVELYRTLCAALKNSDHAEEISQEVFLKMTAYLARPGHEVVIKNPRAFLYKMAYNELYSRHKRKKLEHHLASVFSDNNFELSDNITPEDILLDKEQLKIIQDVIYDLPKQQRKSFLLSRIRNMSHHEIAQSLGIKKASVKQNIVRALSVLRGTGYGQND